jgi:O-methyltransferase involved in polyketide biosynthesis
MVSSIFKFISLESKTELIGSDYALLPVDLRDANLLKTKLDSIKLDPKAPTLVFAECVLVYIKAEDSNKVISYFLQNYEDVYFMNWEMMKLND